MLRFMRTDGGRERDGYYHESKDCTVRAFALAFGIRYHEAHQLLEERVGREYAKPVVLGTLLKACNDVLLGRTLIVTPHENTHGGLATLCAEMGLDTSSARPSVPVLEFMEKHQTGTYLIVILGHIMALRNGILMDNFSAGTTAESVGHLVQTDHVLFSIEVKEVQNNGTKLNH